MPSLENRSIHPLGSLKSYPRRCLAVSYRSLPCRYCCSHTSKHKWRNFDSFIYHSFHKECAVFSYTSEGGKKKNKKQLTQLPLPFYCFFSRKLPSCSDSTFQCHSQPVLGIQHAQVPLTNTYATAGSMGKKTRRS